MAQVNPGSLTDWQNGQTITAEAYKQEREIIYTAINAFVSTTNGSSGADQVGATQLIAGSGTTVQAILEYLYTQLLNTTVGQIPDGSLTDVKLSDAAGNIKQTALLKSGGTMTGTLVLNGNPSGDNDATTKLYVDRASVGSEVYAYRNFGGAL
jgi:ABC-type sulfate transport system substrate-binding protein